MEEPSLREERRFKSWAELTLEGARREGNR